MDSLATLIARQSELKFLDLHYNGFAKEREQRVRSAIANNGCRVKFTEEEYKAYRAEYFVSGASSISSSECKSSFSK